MNKIAYTPYQDVNDLLNDIQGALVDIFKTKLIGIYIYGSLAAEDFDYDKSDIDILVVTSARMSQHEFEQCKDMHIQLKVRHKHAKEDRLEIAYLSLPDMHEIKQQSGEIAVVSPGEPFHIKKVGNDWLINLYLLQEKGIVVFGSPLKSILPIITQEEFKYAIKNQIHDWMQWIHNTQHSRAYQAYAVVTLCRALYAFTFGKPVSKKQAILWAEKNLPKWCMLIHNSFIWQKSDENETTECLENYRLVKEFCSDIDKLISGESREG